MLQIDRRRPPAASIGSKCREVSAQTDPMWDLTEAHVLIDASDYRIIEFAVKGTFLKQPYSVSYRLDLRATSPRSVSADAFEVPAQPAQIVIQGEGTAIPARDVVVPRCASWREVKQGAGDARRAIRADGLTKYYGEVIGVEDLSFEVARGEVYGFLGANGAGKTTTIRLLLDLLRPSRGRATVLGVDCHRDSLAARR